ncbi:MAG TPA: alkaline phosphatase family protein [Mycobacterium sp.]|nr:alkaline phosphatase family protein [Mycobacterium sp.]
MSAGVGAFLALGMTPLAAAPTANADEFDAILDPIVNSLTGSLGDAVGGSAADASSVAAASPFDAALDTWLQGLGQDWANSSFGQQVDAALNGWFHQVVPGAAASDSAAPAMSPNLLVNPNFQIADPSGSGYSGVTIPGWTETGTPTVMQYGTAVHYPFGWSMQLPGSTGIFGFPQTPPPGTPAGDDNFAGGGPVATSSISQTVNLTGAAGTPYELSADLGGQSWDPSYTTVQVNFLDAKGDVIGSGSLNPVTVWDRLGFTGFQPRDITGTVPDGTTSAQVITTFNDHNAALGNYNGSYAANESFTVGDPSLTSAPLTLPTSDVDHLNHVFLIYLENKGNGDIVGSPNAPFLNSLIKTEDYDSNFYALGHPSDPNYIRVMGGSDFGIDYNPDTNVVNAPSLMQEMDQAGVSWASYDQGIAPGTTDITPSDAVNATPFGLFDYVHNNTPAYLQEHIFPQASLSGALQNPSTFPQFAWVLPDEDHNGEGPVDSLSGIGQFILSQLTNQQYNVAAADQYVQQAVSTIESSPTWTDPNEKDAIIITFDEDNNNLSLGFGNEGNNVPMIVIPNQGAVTDGGMQGGPFTTDTYYNQYNLMSTIEDALRPAPGTLAPLTDNDTYASPMNAFWK